MARGNVPATASSRNGTALPAETTGDATNFHYVNNTGRTLVLVRNSGASSRTVTVYPQMTVDGDLTVPSRVISLAAGATKVLGPYPTNIYGTSLNVDVNHAEVMLRAIEVSA